MAGATVGKAGEQLEVRFRDGTKQAVGLSTISHLSLFGRVHVTTALARRVQLQGPWFLPVVPRPADERDGG
jgi:hypothetical protein